MCVARPACHAVDWDIAVPALPLKRVDFDPIVPGIPFDCEEHRWCRSTHELEPFAPMISTSEANVKRDSKVTDRMRCHRTYGPQKSLAYAVSRALRLGRQLRPEAPAIDIMFWADDKCSVLSSDVELIDSEGPNDWKRDWGLNCRSAARTVLSREDCPETLVGRPDILHFGQVPTKVPGRDE